MPPYSAWDAATFDGLPYTDCAGVAPAPNVAPTAHTDDPQKEVTVRSRYRHDRFLFTAMAICCASLLVSCAPTQMTSVWKDSQYTGGALKKLAVIVVTKNDLNRRMVEDEIARDLAGGRTQVVPSYTVLEKLGKDRLAVKNALLAHGFDGALVGRLAAIVKDETYRPPATYVTFGGPYLGPGPYFGTFGDYYGYAYSVAYDPGYTRVDTRVVVETILYKLPEAKPIWTGTTESMNPQSREDLVEKVGRLIEKDLRSANLIDAR